jgi:hypothetical protein
MAVRMEKKPGCEKSLGLLECGHNVDTEQILKGGPKASSEREFYGQYYWTTEMVLRLRITAIVPEDSNSNASIIMAHSERVGTSCCETGSIITSRG